MTERSSSATGKGSLPKPEFAVNRQWLLLGGYSALLSVTLFLAINSVDAALIELLVWISIVISPLLALYCTPWCYHTGWFLLTVSNLIIAAQPQMTLPRFWPWVVALSTLPILELIARRSAPSIKAATPVVDAELLLELFDVVGSDVYVKDLNQRYVFVNAATAASIGKPKAEIIGKRREELCDELNPQLHATLQKGYEHVIAQRESWHSGIYPLVLEDGSTRYFHFIKYPLLDDRGAVRAVFGVSINVTELQKAIEEERRKRGFLDTVVGALPISIYQVNPDVTLDYVYRSLSFMANIKKSPHLAAALTDLSAGSSLAPLLEMLPKSQHYIARALAGEQVTWLEELEHITYEHHLRPEFGSDAEVQHLIGLSLDITELIQVQQALEHEQMRLRTILDELPHPAAITDPTGKFLLANESYLTLRFDQHENAEQKQNGHDMPTSTTLKLQTMNRNALLLGQSQRQVIHLNGADASEEASWFDVIKTPIPDASGELKNIFMLAIDITDRVKSSRRLRTAKEAAEAADRAKTLFLANISHEIRTPMNGVMGMADLLYTTDLTEQQTRYIDIIQARSKHLLRLIDDILLISQSEANQLWFNPEPFAICTLMQAVMQEFGKEVQGRNLLLSCTIDDSVPEMLIGDEVRIRQILDNLLSNAIKYTDEGSIQLSIAAKPRSEQIELHLQVKDTGIGIAQDDLQVLFDPFAQADSSPARRYGGTGLGLAIVRRLCELMGGEVWALSEPGVGSTFHCTLLLESLEDVPPRPERCAELNGKAETTIAEPVAEHEPVLSKLSIPGQGDDNSAAPNILLVEDDETNQQLTLAQLRLLGQEAHVAAGGRTALAMLQERAYPIVLLDLHMPEMDGRETALEIRRRLPADQQPQIILFSADNTFTLAFHLQHSHADGFLAKPYRLEELSAALTAAWQRWQVGAQRTGA